MSMVHVHHSPAAFMKGAAKSTQRRQACPSHSHIANMDPRSLQEAAGASVFLATGAGAGFDARDVTINSLSTQHGDNVAGVDLNL